MHCSFLPAADTPPLRLSCTLRSGCFEDYVICTHALEDRGGVGGCGWGANDEFSIKIKSKMRGRWVTAGTQQLDSWRNAHCCKEQLFDCKGTSSGSKLSTSVCFNFHSTSPITSFNSWLMDTLCLHCHARLLLG